MEGAGRNTCINCKSEGSIIVVLVALNLTAHVPILKLSTELQLVQTKHESTYISVLCFRTFRILPRRGIYRIMYGAALRGPLDCDVI
jgi:hypothetical protein